MIDSSILRDLLRYTIQDYIGLMDNVFHKQEKQLILHGRKMFYNK